MSARDARRGNGIQDLIQDVAYGALRCFLEGALGLVGFAVFVPVLGHCGDTTILTALDATAFRPLPVQGFRIITRARRSA